MVHVCDANRLVHVDTKVRPDARTSANPAHHDAPNTAPKPNVQATANVATPHNADTPGSPGNTPEKYNSNSNPTVDSAECQPIQPTTGQPADETS